MKRKTKKKQQEKFFALDFRNSFAKLVAMKQKRYDFVEKNEVRKLQKQSS
jgi:hypothetical protein